MDPLIGMVMPLATSFAPRGWALCDGQLLAIAEHQALFSIIGTTYGGDGRVTFALPDLRGRVPLHAGHGPGRSARRVGERGGAERTDPPFVWALEDEDGIGAGERTGEDLTQPSLGVHYAIAMVGLYPARGGDVPGLVDDGPTPEPPPPPVASATDLEARVARLEETAARLLKESAALATEAARLRAQLDD